MSRYHFTTVVSKDHLFKFIAMHTSLCLNCSDFRLFVLCADDTVLKILQAIRPKQSMIIPLKEIEDDKIIKSRVDRVFHAFCWTLKSVFLHHVLERFPDAEYYAHLDSDLYFFSNPQDIFNEMPEASLYLTHHRNSLAFMTFYPLTGIYNTGFVGVRRNETTRKAIAQWKEQCLACCPIKEDPDKRLFGDQRYVEEWPRNYEKVHIVKSLGVNTAMWNIANYHVSMKGDNVFINQDPLIFYHFSGLSVINASDFNLSWFYPIEDKNAVNYIYKPYLKTLSTAIREVARYFPWFHDGFIDRAVVPDVHFYQLND